MSLDSLRNTCNPLTQWLQCPPAEVFSPLTDEFLDLAYTKKGMDVKVQTICELARKLHEALKKLPISSEENIPAEEVLGTCTRAIAHNVMAQELRREEELEDDPAAKTYIGWVETATNNLVGELTLHLNNFLPLSKYYSKNIIRNEIDTKEGWSNAVTIPSSEEVKRDKEKFFSYPIKLVNYKDPSLELRGYVVSEKALAILEGDSHLHRSFANNKYLRSGAKLEIYHDSGPHGDKDGKVYGSFIEPRETEELAKTVKKNILIEHVRTLRESNQDLVSEELDSKIVEELSVETQRQAGSRATKKIEESIAQVVEKKAFVHLTGKESQLAHIQDVYSTGVIGKIEVDPGEIQEIRDDVWRMVLDDKEKTAPKIRYPRITPYLIPREGCNILGAETLMSYLEADKKNPYYAEFIDLAIIGIQRYRQQKVLDEKMKRRNITPINI